MKVVCVHLLNDFSGSPRILSQLAYTFVKKGYSVDLFTCKSEKKGFLSDIEGVNSFHFPYRWSPVKLVTLFSFFISQFILFVKLLRYRKQEVTFYINTVLPFGAALAGKLMGKKVIYHVHETSIRPLIFKQFLFFIARKTASEAIYVSQFLVEQDPLKGVPCHVVYNALSGLFVEGILPAKKRTQFHVLMLSSLKEYKGVREYVALASQLPSFSFELVINSSQTDIDVFFEGVNLPDNLTLFPSQQDVHPFYQRANLVLNLSHPLKWVETFGMTALEAMAYGLPVIVPPVGGIAELVDNGVNGHKIDVRDTEILIEAISRLEKDTVYYSSLHQGALSKAAEFNSAVMGNKILSIIE